MSGQTLKDLFGQGVARNVCEATTEEIIGPKEKHLDYLVYRADRPNKMASLLIERTQHSSWVVVFKALITVHHIMCYGNEKFMQYLASNSCTFQLGGFLDNTGEQSYDMSTFIRRYAKYLNEKIVSYRTVSFDFCKWERGSEGGKLGQMTTEQLLKTLRALQNQLDGLLEFDCSTNVLCNEVMSACFKLLLRDVIRLFACYNDGIICLLERYYEISVEHARDALDVYKKFLVRMDRVIEFLKVAESVRIDMDIPELTKIPSHILEALEQHLAQLEGREYSAPAVASVGESNSTQQQEASAVQVDENARKAEEAEVTNPLQNIEGLGESQQTFSECVICYEEQVNCAIYRCGHMCMCYNCASKVWRSGSPHCPICRESIQDVIKIYK